MSYIILCLWRKGKKVLGLNGFSSPNIVIIEKCIILYYVYIFLIRISLYHTYIITWAAPFHSYLSKTPKRINCWESLFESKFNDKSLGWFFSFSLCIYFFGLSKKLLVRCVAIKKAKMSVECCMVLQSSFTFTSKNSRMTGLFNIVC